MSKFVIFASPRTGSTSLAWVLAESKDVKMAIEPFHPDFPSWTPGEKNYSKLIKNSKLMNQYLDEIYKKFTAMKVLDYQFSKSIYSTMLTRKDLKILFLRRKNLVQGAVSNLIGEQTSLWHKTKNEEVYKKLKPIKDSKIIEWVDYVGRLNSYYSNILEKNRKGDFMPLFYEELYSENLEENIKTIKKICTFLNISIPPTRAIKKHMTPSVAKINYNNIYKNLPNYKELENRFGKVF